MLRRLALIVALSSVTAWGAGPRARVVVAKSSELTAYAAVVAGFASEVNAEVEQVVLPEGSEAVVEAMKKIAETKPALILAIGASAAYGAKHGSKDVPVVFAMVPYYQRYEIDAQNVTGIALTSDLSIELSALKTLLPQVKRVGVFHDPRVSAKFVEDAAAQAQKAGLSLVPLEVDSAPKVEKALKGLKSKVDALVLISDRTVGNAAVVQRLLQWGTDEKVAVVGLAPGQVREGALLAFSPVSVGLGQQAGRLANRIMFEKVNPGALAVASPEGLELHVNLGTARRLLDGRDFSLGLFTFAAQKGLAVKPIE